MSYPIHAPMPAVPVIDTRSVAARSAAKGSVAEGSAAKGTRFAALRKLRLLLPVLLLAAFGLWLWFNALSPAQAEPASPDLAGLQPALADLESQPGISIPDDMGNTPSNYAAAAEQIPSRVVDNKTIGDHHPLWGHFVATTSR